MKIERCCFTVMLLVVALVGCSQGEPDATPSANESTPDTTASAGGQFDTEAKAREFGASYINEQVAGKTFTDDAVNPVTLPQVEADTWRLAERNGDRWTLKRGPPGNWYYSAEFNVDGSNPTYEVQYFAE